MKVTVLGAGVIGVASAYYLAQQGHEVTVIDRHAGPAMETSFANAGQISPGYSSPWAAPGIPQKALKWLFMRHAPLIMRPTLDLAMYAWLWRMLANCEAEAYARNKARMIRLAEYSRDLLRLLRHETGITYDDRQRGTLQLFRKQNQVDEAVKDIKVLREHGVEFEVLDRQGCLTVEPGLRSSTQHIAGGLRLPSDETGDCYLFTNRLVNIAAAVGVTFRFDTNIRGLDLSGDEVVGVRTDAGLVKTDAYVLAAGSFSPALARDFSPKLPIYPVKVYSITTDVEVEDAAPVSTVLDETYKIAITRLGDRVRVGGMAELSGHSPRLSQRRRDTLELCLVELFPSMSRSANASFWTGLRPMTPDGTPIVGRLSRNLFVNSGHGTLGWTMACGSGKLIADLISSRQPDIDHEDLGPGRYR